MVFSRYRNNRALGTTHNNPHGWSDNGDDGKVALTWTEAYTEGMRFE